MVTMDRFGKTIILGSDYVRHLGLARACFDAIPRLIEIAVWTKVKPAGHARLDVGIPPNNINPLAHEHTWFWMRRDHEDEEISLDLTDMGDDRVAAAVARFDFALKNAAHHTAFRYLMTDSPVTLLFHRSGAIRLVRDSAAILDGSYEANRKRGRADIVAHIHPVFGAEPTGHEMAAWIKSFAVEMTDTTIPSHDDGPDGDDNAAA